LLSDLTKQVLETGLEVEMEEDLGYAKHAAASDNVWDAPERHDDRRRF
jgi:transposase-like protein